MERPKDRQTDPWLYSTRMEEYADYLEARIAKYEELCSLVAGGFGMWNSHVQEIMSDLEE